MLNWLTELPVDPEQLTVRLLAARLLAALIGGLCVAGFYRLSHGRDRNATSGLVTTLVLLAGLIALVSVVIGSSVARAFSLVGALSIVRFRTVVEDTRDTAFVIFTVVIGMAAGAGLFLVGLMGLPLVGGTAVALSFLWDLPSVASDRKVAGRLLVRLGAGRDPAVLLQPVFERHFDAVSVLESGTWKQGAGIEVVYSAVIREAAQIPQVVMELNQLEGVCGVELKRM